MKKTLLLSLVVIFLVSCGGRLPSPQTAQRIMTKQFHKYGKKYKDTDFGKHPVDRVEISDVQEVQKNIAQVEGYVFLNDGPVYQVRLTLQKKPPFGWRYLAWESLGVR